MRISYRSLHDNGVVYKNSNRILKRSYFTELLSSLNNPTNTNVMKLKTTLFLILTTLFIFRATAQCNGAQFAEINGIAVIEAESPSLPGSWNKETASNPYTGSSYIAWRGADSFNSPGNGTINYSVRINSPGTYRFQWRSKVGIIAATNPSTEHNDSWLKIQGSDFFGMKNGRRIYPKGSGKSPTPEGAGGAGWFKIYSSGTTNWTWSTNTSDNQGYQVYASFNSPGVYTIQVSGRSRGHFIDRMVLYKESSYSASQAQSLSRAQTNCGGGTPPPTPPPAAGNPVVNSFSYINAGNDNVLGTLNNGAQINIANVTSNLSFRANANSDTQSVRMQLTGPVGNTRNDNNAPYSIFGDSGGNYAGRNMQVGNYTLTATPYAQDNLGGTQGSANSISFSIVDNGNTPPPQPPPPSGNTGVTSFTLVNANSNTDIGTITAGRNFTNLPSSLSIRANTNPNSVGSVRFTLSGPINTSKGEGSAPYYLFGDIGVNPIGRSFPNGNYTVTARPRNGAALTISFTVGGGGSAPPPTPTPPPSGNNVVTGFTLVNANSNNDIGAITQGRNFNNVPSSLSIRANTNPSSVGSVRLTLSGPINANKSEGAAPYYLFGDIGVNPIGRSFPNGNYTITANPRNGPPLTISFSIGGGSSKTAVGQEVYVYPNPVKDGRFSVKMPEDVVGEVNYSLISGSGAAVETGKLQIDRAGENAEFNLDSFNQKNTGVYYLILQSGEARYTLPIVKK